MTDTRRDVAERLERDPGPIGSAVCALRSLAWDDDTDATIELCQDEARAVLKELRKADLLHPEGAEEWRPAPGFEGRYEVSNRGRVRSWTGRNGRRKEPHILTPFLDNRGYLTLSLRRDNRNVTTRVHMLVTEAFLGPLPPGMVNNHKDGNKRNAHISNLERVTQTENIQHAFDTGLNPRTKLTPTQAIEVHDRAWAGENQDDIAADYGIAAATVSKIKCHDGWKRLWNEETCQHD